MATTKKDLHSTAADQQPNNALAGADTSNALDEVADVSLTEEIDDAAALCPSCGELLAWHEQACAEVDTHGSTAGPEAPGASATIMRAAGPTYAYDVGQPVQPPFYERPYRVIWRGQLKERHPETGWIHRVNVYWLNDGYWDCYREEELQVA